MVAVGVQKDYNPFVRPCDDLGGRYSVVEVRGKPGIRNAQSLIVRERLSGGQIVRVGLIGVRFWGVSELME